MVALTFIIPVRHQDNARDWSSLKEKLSQTIASISNQTSDDWRAVIVANEGADLPALPGNFSATRVNFPPNNVHERGMATKEDFLDSFRADKGRRVLAGMLDARDSRYFMIVDDDDLVSSGITDYVTQNSTDSGWIVKHGYMWTDSSRLMIEHDDFNGVCGTSLIIRSDVYNLPVEFDDAPIGWVKDYLGSHRDVAAKLADHGVTLKVLPFRGAVYRVANSGSHSGAAGVLRKYFFNRDVVSRPREFVRNLARLRLITGKLRSEFFGAVQFR